MDKRLYRGISSVLLVFALLWLAACGGGGGGGGGGTTPTPILSVAPLTVAFTTTAPDTPPSQTITVSNTGASSTSLAWSASESISWLSLNKGTGTLAGGASDSILATVDIDGLTVGSHNGTITVTADGKTETVNVTLTVNAAPTPTPLLGISAATMTFTAPAESGAAPAAQDLTISNNGDAGTTVDWTLAESLSWLTASATSGSALKDQPAVVSLSVDITGLTQGTYNGTVTVSAPGQTDQTVTVQLTIGAALAANPISLSFSATAGTVPANKTFTLANASNLNVNWTANSNEQWLSVSPSSGTLAAGGQSNQIAVTINSQGLAASSNPYSGTITIGSSTAGVSGLTIPVTLTVNAAAAQSANVFVGGTAGITQLSSLVGAKVSKATATMPTVLADAKVTITVTKPDGSKTVTSTRTNGQGSYSANVSAAQGDTVIITFEKEGYSTFTKTTKVGSTTGSQLTVSGNVATAPPQVVPAEGGAFKANGDTGPGFRFGLMRDRSGERTPFVSASGVRAASVGSVPDLDISIPTSWAPGATSVTASLASFDPNNEAQRQMFPGQFVGVGGGSAAVAKADTNEYALESVSFFQSNVTPDTGQPLAPTGATGASKAADEDKTVIYKWIPTDGCVAMKKHFDRDKEPANGIQVPLYTYNPNSGKWGYLGEGTLMTFNDGSGAYDTVPAANFADSNNLLDELACSAEPYVESPYYFRIVADSWYTWWNLDYPLLFTEPENVCISGKVVDNGGNPIPGAYVTADGYARGGRSYVYTYANPDGTFSFDLNLGDAETVANYQFTAYNYATWPAQSTDFSDLMPPQINTTACNDVGDVVIVDPLSCRITGTLLEETGAGYLPFAGTWIEANNASYSYYNWAQTNAAGTFTLKSRCNEPITLRAWGQSLSVNVNGAVAGSENTDTGPNPGGVVDLKTIRKANAAPEVDIWSWPNPVKIGQTVEVEAWAWDFEGDYPLTYSWSITGSTTTTSALPRFNWTPAAAGTYTATVTVTDSKGKSTVKSQVITVNTNKPPVIWSAWANATEACGFPNVYVNAYDPDGDKFNLSWSAGNPVYDAAVGAYVPTEAVFGSVTVTATDNGQPQASTQRNIAIPAAQGLQLYNADAWPLSPVKGETVYLYAEARENSIDGPTYAWSVIGPAGEAVVVSNPNLANASFQPLAAGDYAVTLIVQGSCESVTRTFTVTVASSGGVDVIIR